MGRNLLTSRQVGTTADPVAAYVAHLRYLARSGGFAEVLREGHGYSKGDASTIASRAAAFIDQGLQFHDAAAASPARVRPVLQYYAYLNLAVAVVITYQPPNWENVKSHGASDLTWDLTRLGATSNVVRVKD